MNEFLLVALKSYYQGKINVARANIDVYLKNPASVAPAGLGEHPDIVGAIDEQVAALAESDEKLETLNKYFPS